ncbi:MAG: HAMP domain-containing protein [Candidatus Eisenbacteria bacterium]|nr:HAMP domain-containing protein [Candidatus Eisenbacteria bacterium]
MQRNRLLWQLYPPIVIIAVIGLVTVGWFVSRSVRDFHIEQIQSDLLARARLVREQVRRPLLAGDEAAVDSLSKVLGKAGAARITIILPGGRVAGDSQEDPGRLEPHTGRNRPELGSAMRGASGATIRFSQSQQRTMVYAAVPIWESPGKTLIGVSRTAIPLTHADQALEVIRLDILWVAVVVGLLLAGASYLITRRIARPLAELRRGAEEFARGSLDSRIYLPDIAELGELADGMNRMAAELKHRIRTITRQRNEQEAILASMTEGVLAVDMEGRVRIMNAACGRMLKLDPRWAEGQSIQEIVRIPGLNRLIMRTLSRAEPLEGDILLGDGEETYLQVHGGPLRGTQGHQIGVLVVLNDVTRIRRLERMRRDFVANVSHELKTPITSIKAAVETLQDGAVEEVQAARRFLEIMGRQSNRLNAIIEDLLKLSRIEQGTESSGIELSQNEIRPVLLAAIQACEPKAQEKSIQVELQCERDYMARINPPLLENAVVNLIDNALKYSEARTRVALEVRAAPKELLICVADQGQGIEEQHLPRLFERFYRVDKARSRTLGGTGLGLAIVKHVALAHGGRVSVESTVGKGSIFCLHVPRSP